MKFKTFIFIFLVFVFHIIIINVVAELRVFGIKSSETGNTFSPGKLVNIGISDRVITLVEKERWYGEIITLDNLEIVNLFGFKIIRIPVKVNGNSWVLANLVPIFISIILIKREKKNAVRNDNILDYSSNPFNNDLPTYS